MSDIKYNKQELMEFKEMIALADKSLFSFIDDIVDMDEFKSVVNAKNQLKELIDQNPERVKLMLEKLNSEK